MAASTRGVLRSMAEKARREAGSLPLYYSEWSSSPGSRDPYHDDPYAAAFIVKTIADNQGLVDLYSYWTFTDILEEAYFPSLPFHVGFGLLNLHGIPKPAYHGFRLLGALGDKRLAVSGGDGTVECLAVRDGDDIGILAYNHQIPLAPVRTESVRLVIQGSFAGSGEWSLVRVDDSHGNPKRSWIEAGSPEYLTRRFAEKLALESELKAESLSPVRKGRDLTLELTLPPHGVAGIFSGGRLFDRLMKGLRR
jgi:xylan 1,4-beta-xylosidase